MMGATGQNNERQIEFGLSDVYEILYRRRLLLLLGVVVGLLCGLYLAQRPRKFRSEGSIRIQPSRGAMYRTSPIAAESGNSDQIASEIAILQSRTLYLRVARELDLANQPAFWGRRHIDPQSIDTPQVRDYTLARMQAKIKVDHSPKDDIVVISVTTTSRDLSARIVNTLINNYVESLFKMSYGATQRSANFLIGQLDDLKQQIERDQTTLTQLQGKLGLIGLDEKNSNYLLAESLDQITKASSDATIQRILAEAKYRFVAESDPSLIESEQPLLSNGASTQGLLQSLRGDQARDAEAYARLSAQFGPNYPDVKHAKAELDAVNAQVKAEQDRIINQAKLGYKAAAANEQMTNGAATKIRGEAANSQSDMVKYAILLHDYEAHRSLYEGLVQRLREAGITSGMESGEIDIVDLADPPSMPESPGPAMVMVGALFAGLLLGAFISLIAELLDAKISSTDQAEKLVPLPLLSAVPRLTKANLADTANRHQPEALLLPRSAYAEAMQSLRTSLLLMNRPHPCKVIVVTSALPGEGKSTTARNLATVFSQHNTRTILIDCDLRRGRVANSLGIKNAPGLSGVLMDRSTVENAAFPVEGAKNLKVLPSGPYPPQAAILVSSQAMIDLVAQCRERYDCVILDCPPVIGLTDSLIIAEHADALLMVVREDYSRKRAVRDAVRSLGMLKHVPMGFVMNSVDDKSHSYGYGRYYAAYYGDPKGGPAE